MSEKTFRQGDSIEVVDGRWNGCCGVVEHVIPIRVDGREIGERYGVVLTPSELFPKVPPLVTLLAPQLKIRG